MVFQMEGEQIRQILLDEGVLDQEELQEAMTLQEDVGGELADVLVKFDFVTEEELTRVIARKHNLEPVNLNNLILPEALIQELPRDVLEQHEVLPVRRNEGSVTLAIHDPSDFEAIEEVQLVTDYTVEPALAPRKQIVGALNQIFEPEETPPEKETSPESDAEPEATGQTGEERPEEENELLEELVRSREKDLLEGLVRALDGEDVLSAEQLQSYLNQES